MAINLINELFIRLLEQLIVIFLVVINHFFTFK